MHSANLGRRWWLGVGIQSSCWSAIPEDKDILTFALEKDDKATKKYQMAFILKYMALQKSTYGIWKSYILLIFNHALLL